MCEYHHFVCCICSNTAHQYFRPCLIRNTNKCKQQRKYDLKYSPKPNTPCPHCWNRATLPNLDPATSFTKHNVFFTLFWSYLKKYPHGQELLSYDFTSIPSFSEMEAFSYLTYWAELDFVCRLRFSEASLFKPDAFEETILRKMIATWYENGVDERPQLDPREERTELIIELGKRKAKRQIAGEEEQEQRCSICLASTIIEDDAPGDFEFFLGFNGKSFSRDFDLASFLGDDFDNDSGDEQEEQACMTPCNHLFGHQCLRKWLNTRKLKPSSKAQDCPMCRASFGNFARIEAQYQYGKEPPAWWAIIMRTANRAMREAKEMEKKASTD